MLGRNLNNAAREVEDAGPLGDLEDDPNVTDKKFPGNPTKSYRTREPVRVVGEVTGWRGHSAEELATMKAGLERLKEQGIEHIDD